MSGEWTPLKLIQWTSPFFEKKGIPNPRLDAELLLAHVLRCKRIDLYTAFDAIVSEKDLAKYKSLLERRITREPLQYILGETEFWGLKIKVTPDVLIPRPETETLVEECLKILKAIPDPTDLNILDIGTGSGYIAISIAKNIPNAKIIATDLSKEALAIAGENAAAHEVADRIEFIPADIAPWKSFEAQDKKFDLIVSNPPYIPETEMKTLQEEVRDFEPHRALSGGPLGLDVIEKIVLESPFFLRSPGFLVMETSEGHPSHLSEKHPSDSPYAAPTVLKDLTGRERFVSYSLKSSVR